MDTGPNDLQRAKRIAYRALSKRAMTEQEICERLVKKGFDERTVEAAVVDLKHLRLIDDAAFARMWAEERMRRKPMGQERLDAELASKGIPEEIRNAILSETFVGIDPVAIAIEALRKKVGIYGRFDRETALRRMTGFLLRRGFDDETATTAAKTVWKHHIETQ
jgi:regulatory protein